MSNVRPTSTTRWSAEFEAALVTLKSQRWDEAIGLLQKVVQHEAGNAIAWNCLGIAAAAKKDYRDALQAYDTAIQLQPQLAEAHSNRGNVLRVLGEWENAQSAYQQAIAIKPELAEAHNGLGTCHQHTNQLDEAATCYERAVAIQPQRVEAWNNLGNVRVAQARPEEALRCYEVAWKQTPTAEIQCNLGNALRDLGRLDDAARAYQTAIEMHRGLAEAWNNLGTLRFMQQRLPEAIECFREAVRLSPTRVDFLLNLSNALIREEHLDEATAALDRLAAATSTHVRHRIRRHSLCPAVFPDRDSMQAWRDDALTNWNALAAETESMAESAAGARVVAELQALVHEGCEPPFNLQFLDGNLRELKQAYANLFAGSLPKVTPKRNEGPPRVGFVVTRGHEGVFLRSLGPLLQHASQSKAQPEPVEWIVFAPRESGEAVAAAIGSLRVEVRALVEPLPKKIEQLLEAACDVLCYFEIGTDATNYFLPQLRLARIQCTTWGVQVTSGIKNVDYYLSSRLVEADHAATHYSESLLLAETLLTYQLPDAADRFRRQTATANAAESVEAARERWGLTSREHVYVCAQHLGKFHPGFDKVLGGILRRDEQAVLLITKDRSGQSSDRLLQRFTQTLPDVVSRIRFLPRLDAVDYYRLLAVADVLLDPPHFGGVNSTYDGLLLGKPIVTRPTDFHRGRYTTGCYARMTMTECITNSEEAYVEKAVRLGVDADYRRAVAERIVERREPLFQDRQAVQEFVRLFAFMIAQARERSYDD
ncbi:MAG: hypothetical protein RIS70_3132 [Planctomycetota bacterium]